MNPFWFTINQAELRQGDWLPGCWIPEFPPDFAAQSNETRVIQADQADLIVMTQSCDIEQGNVSLVALCPLWSIPAFEEAQASQGRGKSAKAWREYWNNVRKGRSPTLHLLASPTTPLEARAAWLVDFRAIYIVNAEGVVFLTQNPKSEEPNPKEIRNTKSEMSPRRKPASTSSVAASSRSDFVRWVSFGFGSLVFGFAASPRYSLPIDYLTRNASQLGDRWRLCSPFLEHFSQAFARSFMRVGLPSSVPEF